VGLTAAIDKLAVVGAGPHALPPRVVPKLRDLRGQLILYKSRRPLAGAALALCAGSLDRKCTGAPFVRRAVSDAEGHFRLPRVPEGTFFVYVDVPKRHEDCRSPFTAGNFFTVSPATDCPPDKTTCDLGEQKVCLPFEMPPPPRK
jgi:hypothetical protein